MGANEKSAWSNLVEPGDSKPGVQRTKSGPITKNPFSLTWSSSIPFSRGNINGGEPLMRMSCGRNES
jgi:hypothetical protein